MNHRRREEIRDRMRKAGVDALVIGPGADLFYLTGYNAMLSERLTALYLDLEGHEDLYIPVLEAPRATASDADIVSWTEEQNPVELIASKARSAGGSCIGVGDMLWSGFLLELQRLLPDATWTPASEVLADARKIKSADEIELLRQSGKTADRVWSRITQTDLEGKSESAIARILTEMLLEDGLDSVDFAIVGSGPNSASPHHHAGERHLQAGDMVVFDFGGTRKGYFCDITRMAHVGLLSKREREVYDVVKEAQEEAVRVVRPGIPASEVDERARSILREAKLDQYFIHRTGHGLGLEEHEPPYIRGDSDELLREGMVFSIEPGAYIPGHFGVRIEDIVVVTAQGCERLNNASREIVQL